MVDGLTVEEIEAKLSGIICGRRPTSCGDQLAKAVRKAYEESQYQPDDGNTEVYYLQNAKAQICSFKEVPKTIEF